MELTIRDWMIVVGAAMVLVVLVDAMRRIYRERKTEIRLNAKVSRQGNHEDTEFNLLSELPNGGARIVRRHDLSPLGHDDVITDSPEGLVPLEDSDNYRGSIFASFSALDDEAEFVDELSARTPSSEVDPQQNDPKQSHVEPEGTPETLDWLDQLDTPEPEPEARLPRGVDPHVFVLNVVARDEAGFAGQDIMQILLECDLRFGDMDFFHRHEQSAGRGPIQFSVANMMKPGVFDIDHMDHLQTRGLMFFVTLPGPQDMLMAFDYMYETAKAVAKNLKGDVLDDTRSAITRQSIDHMRQQIRELERRIARES